MNSGAVRIPQWNPSKGQSELFKEWKGLTIAHLVSSKKGIQPHKIPGSMESEMGEKFPLDKMGFERPNIHQFLYQLRSDIEVRMWNEEIYVFLKEHAVPGTMDHIRKMVLGQKGKGDKPLKHHGTGVQASELLRFRPRPAPTPSTNRNRGRGRGGGRGRRGTSAAPRNSNVTRQPASRPTSTSNYGSRGRFQSSVPTTSTGAANRPPLRETTNADFDYPVIALAPKPTTSTGAANRAPLRETTNADFDYPVIAPGPKPKASTVSQSSPRTSAPAHDSELDGDFDDLDGFDYVSSASKNCKSDPTPALAKTVTTTTQEQKKIMTPTSISKTLEPQPQKVACSYSHSIAPTSLTLTKAEPLQKRTALQTPDMESLRKTMAEERLSAAIAVKGKGAPIVTPTGPTNPIVNGTGPKIQEKLSRSSTPPIVPASPQAFTSMEQQPDLISQTEFAKRIANIDMEIHYGYTIEPYPSPYPYEIEPVSAPPRLSVFKPIIRFPPYLIASPKTFREYLEERGEFEKYKNEIESLPFGFNKDL